MSKVSHLKIVPYNPTDYSLGEYLVKEHGTISEDEQFIGGALSLYFQWPDHAFCHLSNTPKDEEPTKCTLDYDRDERFPTELWIRYSGSRVFKEFDKVFIRFEVFRTCYEFDVSVLAINTESEETFLVCSIPQKIQVYKNRRFPRVYLKEDQKLEIEWIKNDSNQSIKLSVKEIGMKSIATCLADKIETGIGVLKISGLNVQAELFKITKSKAIFVLKFEKSVDAGHFFDVYRLFAYENITNRYAEKYSEGINLFKKSGYFSKFSSSDIANAEIELPKIWDIIRESNHINNIDYYTKAEDLITGSSSLTNAFKTKNEEVWAFHQLCALQIPIFLRHSGMLYTWRAEYLLNRNESIKSIVWFDGKSRWIERLYVNFSNSNKNTRLYAIKAERVTFYSKNNDEVVEIKKIKFGNLERYCIVNEGTYIAFNPVYLNAVKNLEICFVEDSKKNSFEKIKSIIEKALYLLNISHANILITHQYPNKISENDLAPATRVFICNKIDLIEFISFVDHSIEITNKKVNNA